MFFSTPLSEYEVCDYDIDRKWSSNRPLEDSNINFLRGYHSTGSNVFLGKAYAHPREIILRVHDGYSKCRGPFELFESGKRGCRKGMQGTVGPAKYR